MTVMWWALPALLLVCGEPAAVASPCTYGSCNTSCVACGAAHPGVTYCPNNPAKGQCDGPPIRCPNHTIVHYGIAAAGSALGHPKLPSAEACCSACGSTAGCTAWTYHNMKSPSMPGECWLMPAPGEPHGQGVISGVPPTPPPPPPPPPLPPPPGPSRDPPLGFAPHAVFVLTDDQDITQDSMLAMPQTRSLFGLSGPHEVTSGCAGGGACFNLSRGYVATPICCPSRSSYLTGQYIHNTGTRQNRPAMGCASAQFAAEKEPRTYAAYLGGAGTYAAGFFGKYLNSYGSRGSGEPLSYVPPGWSEWVGLQGNSRYYDYTLSVNGVPEKHGSDYATDYFTDLLHNRSVAFIRKTLLQAASAVVAKPLLAVVHTPAPHRPSMPAPQYMNSFTGLKAPRTPSWNYISKDKHQFLSDLEPMDNTTTVYSDHVWRRRLRSLQSVDDLVAGLFEAVASSPGDAMNRTVFIYSSDHGYHSGQWGVAYCKMLPYEEDVRIPMFVRLPPSARHPPSPGGVAHVVSSPTMNIDIAPFLLDLAGFAPDPMMDGSSVLPLLDAAAATTTTTTTAGRTFLIEYFPIPASGNDQQVTRKGADGWCTDPDVKRDPCPPIPVIVDSVNNTWACVRSLDADHAGQDEIYCNFYDGSGVDVDWVRTKSNFAEYYDMSVEPWQLHNGLEGLASARRKLLQGRLEKLMVCKGRAECEEAATTSVVS